jgi:glycosyltransferase involved in cell wall biosynthesis
VVVFDGTPDAVVNYPGDWDKDFDVIYVPEWDWKNDLAVKTTSVLYQVRNKVFFGAHSVIQFVGLDIDNSSQLVFLPTSIERVGAFVAGKQMMTTTLSKWFQQNAPLVGCVSQQLCSLVKTQDINTVPFITHCGVDDSIVDATLRRLAKPPPLVTLNRKLRVVFTPPIQPTCYAFDVKRAWMVDELTKRLEGLVDIIRVPVGPWMSTEQVDKWMDALDCDVVLCTSHTEGNPLCLLEMGGRGCIAVTTDVGIARELVFDDITGYIVPQNDTHQQAVVFGLEQALRKLVTMSPDNLQRMKHNMLNQIDRFWRWSHVAKEWITFFELAKRSSLL